MKVYIYPLLLIMLFSVGCQKSPFSSQAKKNSEFIENEFVGTWKIDSIKLKAHDYYKHEYIGIFNDTTFVNFGKLHINEWTREDNSSQHIMSTDFTLSHAGEDYSLAFNSLTFAKENMNTSMYFKKAVPQNTEVNKLVANLGFTDNFDMNIEDNNKLVLFGLNRGLTIMLSK